MRPGISKIVGGVLGFVLLSILYASYANSGVLTLQLMKALSSLSYVYFLVFSASLAATLIGIGEFAPRIESGSHMYFLRLLREIMAIGRYRTAFLLGFLAYGVFFAFVSSTVVYQPTLEFSKVYLAQIPSVRPIPCCGAPFFIPMLTVYLTEHLGLLLIPANLVMLLTVSILVGANVSMTAYTLDHRPKQVGKSWMAQIGTVAGLFTACPTCAGLFMASILGGASLTSAVTILAGLQLLFIGVALPALVLSLFLQTRTITAACSLPADSKKQTA